MRPRYPAAHGWESPKAWGFFITILIVMIGWRHEVGGDWWSYLGHVEAVAGRSLASVFQGRHDPAYVFLNWLGANLGGGIYFVNIVCAVIFSLGLAAFCNAQPRPWLALTVAVPYLVIVVAMGYTRQGVAIGLAMLAISSLERGGFARFLFWITLAATFHKSAIILVPLAIFAGRKNRVVMVIGAVIACITLYALLLQEAISSFRYGYLEREYNSSGAAIRIAMNAIPAFLFLLCRRRFLLNSSVRSFWVWMSISSLCFIPILVVLPSSTAVDRVALYWIPLQLFVFSRLPDALGKFGSRNQLFVSCVLAYCTATLFVWLVFARNADQWIPYRFYPFVYFFNG